MTLKTQTHTRTLLRGKISVTHKAGWSLITFSWRIWTKGHLDICYWVALGLYLTVYSDMHGVDDMLWLSDLWQETYYFHLSLQRVLCQQSLPVSTVSPLCCFVACGVYLALMLTSCLLLFWCVVLSWVWRRSCQTDTYSLDCLHCPVRGHASHILCYTRVLLCPIRSLCDILPDSALVPP